MRRIVICLSILLLLTSTTFAQKKQKSKDEFDFTGIEPITLSSLRLDWMPIMTTDNEMYFLHKKRIRTKQNTIKVWVSKDPTAKGKGLRSVTSYEVNCSQELMRVRAINFYNSDGKFLMSDSEIKKWEDVAPDTLGDEILTQVCKNISHKSRR